jgi:hypothetical protein
MMRSCLLLTLGVAAVYASSLTVVTSNIPPEADRLAIVVDGGGLTAAVNAYQDITPGSRTASTYTFANIPAVGPFRARVLAYNQQTGTPLRTGRATGVPAGGSATVTLGDVFPPYTTTPFMRVPYGSTAVVSFRVADPGGWLEGTSPHVFTSFSTPSRAAVLKNLPASGVWDISTALQLPITAGANYYSLSVEFPLPAEQPSLLYMSSPATYLILDAVTTVTLTLSAVPAGTQNVHILLDGPNTLGVVAATVAAPRTDAGTASTWFSAPAGSYRVRVAASDSKSLLASGQTRITIPPSGSTTVPLQLGLVSGNIDPGVPDNGVAFRWAQISVTVTDPGGVLEGVVPFLLTGDTADSMQTTHTGTHSFQRVSPTAWRTSLLLPQQSYYTGTVYYQPFVGPIAQGRTDSLRIAPAQSMRVTEPPGACSASEIAPVTLNASGGSGTVVVPTQAGCPWSFHSDSPWLTVFPASGVGPSTVTWTALPNFAADYRVGHLMLGDVAFFVGEYGSPDPDDARLVKLAYYAFLGRYPTQAELDFQMAALEAGFSRTSLIDSFASSQEFQLGGRFIAGLYYGILNRDAEYSGWLYQRNAMLSGQVTASTLIDNFLNSQEYRLRFGTPDNAGFVRLLYRNVLMREATQAEVDFQVNALVTRQVSRNVMTYAFLNSAEFARLAGPRLTAFLAYAALLGRDGTDFELTDTAASITGGLTQRGLIDSIVNGREFSHQVNNVYWF